MKKSSGDKISRRNFLQTCTTATTVGSVPLLLPGCNNSLIISGPTTHSNKGIIKKNSTILFQGDSITDAGRDKSKQDNANDPNALGRGYVYLVAARLLADRAGDNLRVYNRGISGNKVFQLADRWDKDCLQLKPDVLSILIGVNDIWHALSGRYDGTVEKYEADYWALLTRTSRELPDLKLVICEPFVLHCGAVDNRWLPEFDRYRAAAKKMSQEFNALFVGFQSMFDQASKRAPAARWAADGVHPTMAGASLMAQEWLNTVV